MNVLGQKQTDTDSKHTHTQKKISMQKSSLCFQAIILYWLQKCTKDQTEQ